MFSYQSVNSANIVSLEDSEKNWNFWKKKKKQQKTFYRKIMFFQNIWNFLFLVITMIYPKHNLASSIFLGVKDRQIWPEIGANPFEAKIASMIPHRPWIIYRGYL